MKNVRQFLLKLPFDCRLLWMRLSFIKEETTSLKTEINNLIHQKLFNGDD